VTTCEKRISVGVTPATHDLSKSPSVRSMINADEVKATAKKKTILQKGKKDDEKDDSSLLKAGQLT
jgi:hypothetical protein